MKREEFAAFVESTIEEILSLAEEKCGTILQRKYAFRWLGRSHATVFDNVIEHIVERVFVDEEHIYPCVDIGVGDILEDGSLLVVGNVAGYAPRPFWPKLDRTDGAVCSCRRSAILEQNRGKRHKMVSRGNVQLHNLRYEEALKQSSIQHSAFSRTKSGSLVEIKCQDKPTTLGGNVLFCGATRDLLCVARIIYRMR